MKTLSVRDLTHGYIKKMAIDMGASSMADVVDLAILQFKPPKVDKSPRVIAEELGVVKYMGEPCQYGHDGERYSKTGQCVTCWKARSRTTKVDGEGFEKRIERYNALKAGFKHYYSTVPCDCGNEERWLKSGQCNWCYSGDGRKIR